MATRKKASSTSSRSASKPAKRTAPAKGAKRKSSRAAAAPDERDRDEGGDEDDADREAVDAAEHDEEDENSARDVAAHDDEAAADDDAAADAADDDDPPPVARRPRAVQRSAPGSAPVPAPAPAPAASRPGALGRSAAPPPAAPLAAASAPPAAVVSHSTVRAGTRPFVVARGEDTTKVFAETLRHSGFYEAVENAQIKSGKRRELFEVACKVDFMRGVRRENEPASYVDPKLVAQLFNGLLDRGFRILRVVETRGELSRYLANRSVKQVGNALGYDESCYELKDLADDLMPIEIGAAGKRPTGRIWKQADFRIVFAKARTDEQWGPALVLWNLWHVMATPSDLLSLEYGMDPGDLALTLLEKLPVHFALIDAVHVRDGSAGGVFPYEVLKAIDPAAPDAAQNHRFGTIVAGTEPLAVEAAGHKLQGLDPQVDPNCLRKLRKLTGWKSPSEAEALPTFPGWKGIGNRIREAIGSEKQVDALRLALFATLQQADPRLFPPVASAYFTIRLRQRVEAFVEELRRRHGVRGGASAAGSARTSDPSASSGDPDGDFEEDDDDGSGPGGPSSPSGPPRSGPAGGPANFPPRGPSRGPAGGGFDDDDPPTFH